MRRIRATDGESPCSFRGNNQPSSQRLRGHQQVGARFQSPSRRERPSNHFCLIRAALALALAVRIGRDRHNHIGTKFFGFPRVGLPPALGKPVSEPGNLLVLQEQDRVVRQLVRFAKTPCLAECIELIEAQTTKWFPILTRRRVRARGHRRFPPCAAVAYRFGDRPTCRESLRTGRNQTPVHQGPVAQPARRRSPYRGESRA